MNATLRRKAPRFLIAGSLVPETVTHRETGLSRHDVGGVASQMAAALAGAGMSPTLLASIAHNHAEAAATQTMAKAGVRVSAPADAAVAGWSAITTKNGEPQSSRGQWPEPQRLAERVQQELNDNQWLMLDTNVGVRQMTQCLEMAQERRIATSVHCAAVAHVDAIWQTRQTTKHVVTMNISEAQSMLEGFETIEPDQLRQSLNARCLLVTMGSEGWLASRPEGIVRSRAIATPSHTDFVGCGDYAAAGLCYAIATRQPISNVINAFIQRRMEQNQMTPP